MQDAGETAQEAIEADQKAGPALAMQFKTAAMANETELEKAYLVDVQSARDRDVKLAQVWLHNRRAHVMLRLTYAVITALVTLIVWEDIDANFGGVVMLVIGKLIAQWEQDFNFEFGITCGSKSKDDTISRLTGK